MYEALPSLLREPYDPDAADEAVAALINRDAMAGEDTLEDRLAELDLRVAEALVTASEDWRAEVHECAAACGFAASPWWMAVLAMSTDAKQLAPAAP